MNIARNLKRYLQIAAIAIGAILSAPTIAMPVLVGSATLNIANDLTVIQNGAQTLQFLDLTVTQGSSVANALVTFGASGFTWATGAEVAQLYAAFGFTYASAPNLPIALIVPAVNAASYTSFLGTTSLDASLGWIDDNTTALLHTYDCISQIACTPTSTVGNGSFGWPSHPAIGVYLVREAQRAVPEPATLGLLGLGLFALVSRLRGKRRAA